MSPRHEDDLLFTVATVWREERVSCPHVDVLRAFDARSLEEGAEAFVRFHLEDSQCPYCNAILEDLRVSDAEAKERRLGDLRDRLLRSTVTEIRRASRA